MPVVTRWLDSPGMCHRIEELLATSLLVLGHLGSAIGRPTPVLERRKQKVLEKLPHLEHRSQKGT